MRRRPPRGGRWRAAGPRRTALALAGLCLGLPACASAHPFARPAVLPRLAAVASAVPRSAAPAGVDAETAQGAAAFARAYFERLNVAYLRRDVSLLTGLTDPSCTSCRNFAGDIQALVANGHHLVGDSFDVVSADAPPVEGHSDVVDLVFSTPGAVEYTDAGAYLLTRRATAGQVYLVQVDFGPAGWRVREVRLP